MARQHGFDEDGTRDPEVVASFLVVVVRPAASHHSLGESTGVVSHGAGPGNRENFCAQFVRFHCVPETRFVAIESARNFSDRCDTPTHSLLSNERPRGNQMRLATDRSEFLWTAIEVLACVFDQHI